MTLLLESCWVNRNRYTSVCYWSFIEIRKYLWIYKKNQRSSGKQLRSYSATSVIRHSVKKIWLQSMTLVTPWKHAPSQMFYHAEFGLSSFRQLLRICWLPVFVGRSTFTYYRSKEDSHWLVPTIHFPVEYSPIRSLYWLPLSLFCGFIFKTKSWNWVCIQRWWVAVGLICDPLTL